MRHLTFRMILLSTLVTACLIALVSTAWAKAGPIFSFNAQVLTDDGTPLNEKVSMYVSVYDSADGTGDPVWSQFYPVVNIVHGDFVVNLGGGVVLLQKGSYFGFD